MESKREVHLSTAVLLTIGTFDLLTTMFWVLRGGQEGNRLFGWLLEYGLLPFAIGKLLFLLGPVLILEYARKSHPKSAEQGTWIAATAYVFYYVTHLLALRGG